jgi:hypothetical protein
MFAKIRRKLQDRKQIKDLNKRNREAERADRSFPDPRQDVSSGSRGGPNITGGAGGVM